jgi:hypothetical protein
MIRHISGASCGLPTLGQTQFSLNIRVVHKSMCLALWIGKSCDCKFATSKFLFETGFSTDALRFHNPFEG